MALANELAMDADYLLALGGKISEDVQEIIKKRPELFAKTVREMQEIPDEIIEEKGVFHNRSATLDRLHDMAGIGAFQFSEKKNTTFWTSQIPKTLNLPPDCQPCLEALFTALTDESKDQLQKAVAQALLEKTSYQCEVRLKKGKALATALRIWGCVEANDKGGAGTHLGMIQDISEYAELQDQIQSAQNALQLQVNKKDTEITTAIQKLNQEIRSRNILEVNLQVLNRKILRQSESQKNFFKGHAYQLRSLITRIASTNDPKEKGERTDLNRLLNRILPKIDDLGDFLTSQDELTPSFGDTDIHKTMDDIKAGFEPTIVESGLSMVESRDPKLPRFITTDERRLRQILTSIMELFALNTQWGTIQLSATINNDGTQLLVTFSAPSTQTPVDRTMFSPKKDSDAASPLTNPVQMVSPLLEMLHGKLTITGSTGAGVSITVSLPVDVPFAQIPPALPSSLTTDEHPVLIVEDDPQNLLYIRKTMELAGFVTEEATDGPTAFALLNDREFKILLLDIQLPDIDGVTITKNLRTHPDAINHAIPIIAVTAHAAPEDRNRFLQAGINGIVVKPFEKEELLTKVAQLLLPETNNQDI